MLSRIRPVHFALLIAPWMFGFVRADDPHDVVQWTASVQSPPRITRGSTATLDLSGDIQEGWHVYGLEQQPRGPTPLRVTLDSNAVVTTAGTTSGSAPEKVHDSHFGFDTQLYTHAFVIHLPVQVSADLAAGRQLIPVSVRFQACSDRECLLPKTVHLSVPIEVSG
jgi:hypothetical protein